MAKAYLGSTQLKKAYIGSTAIKKIYRGSTLIWSGYQAETLAQKVRIEANGGTVIDLEWIDLVISTLKTLGIYSNCKLLTDANFGIKKDITGAVSKLYDISGNNNDAVQTTGASQPIWSLINGRGVINYVGSKFLTTNIINHNVGIGDFTYYVKINIISYTTGAPGAGFFSNGEYAPSFIIPATNHTDLALYWGGYKDSGVIIPLSVNHSVVTSRKTGIFTFYDNTMVCPNTYSVPTSLTNAKMVIGRSGVLYSPDVFKGFINTNIFFNIALTQEQISILYNLGL